MTTFDLFEYIEEEEEAHRGGGGLVTQVSVTGGWLALATGVPSEERFFPFFSEEDGEVARQKGLAAASEKKWKNSEGKPASVSLAVRVTTYGGDSILNRATPSFEGEISNHMVTFGSAYKEVFKEMSQPDWYEGYTWGETMWALVKYSPDPDRPTYTNAAGETKDNIVPYIAVVYADREEAEVAAFALMNGGVVIDIPPVPDGYEFGDWGDFWTGMVDEYGKGDDADLSQYEELVGTYGITLQHLAQAKKQATEIKETDEIPF